MKTLYKILPHILIVLAGMFIVLFTVDKINSAMAFINNDITKALLAVFSVVALINAILFIRLQRRQP